MCETKSQQFPHCALNTVWKNKKITVVKKKRNRQINSLLLSLVKSLLSRNFYQESVIVDFCNFHTLLIMQWDNYVYDYYSLF